MQFSIDLNYIEGVDNSEITFGNCIGGRAEDSDWIIDVNDFSGLTYSIHSPQGQLITQGMVEKNPFSIDISGYATGVYFVYIYSNMNKTKLIKIIKN